MSKGSKPRPISKPKFDENWDEINWKSKPKKDEDEKDESTATDNNTQR